MSSGATAIAKRGNGEPAKRRVQSPGFARSRMSPRIGARIGPGGSDSCRFHRRKPTKTLLASPLFIWPRGWGQPRDAADGDHRSRHVRGHETRSTGGGRGPLLPNGRPKARRLAFFSRIRPPCVPLRHFSWRAEGGDIERKCLTFALFWPSTNSLPWRRASLIPDCWHSTGYVRLPFLLGPAT
jgi:hypothetical protein